ncbi:hypothetical protein ALP71_04104, partial [Pseudomonas coronafaciens pv. garcae]
MPGVLPPDHFRSADRWPGLESGCSQRERMMQKIYEPENLMEAELLQTMLASEGIRAHLAGRDLLGAMGELPGLGLLAIKVEDAQVERA